MGEILMQGGNEEDENWVETKTTQGIILYYLIVYFI